MGEHVAHMAELRNAYKIFVGNLKGRRLFRSCGYRQEDDIKVDLWGNRVTGLNWIHLSQYRDEWWALVNMIMNLQVP
jgi:hypothetical protein